MSEPTSRPVLARYQDAEQVASPQAQLLTPMIHRGVATVEGLSMGVVHMPPCGVSEPHLHEHSDIIVCVLEGWAATLWGDTMEPMKPMAQGPMDMVWVPAGVPHMAVNLSPQDKVMAVEARTDPHFNKDVVLLPDRRELAMTRVPELREEHQRQLAARWTA